MYFNNDARIPWVVQKLMSLKFLSNNLVVTTAPNTESNHVTQQKTVGCSIFSGNVDKYRNDDSRNLHGCREKAAETIQNRGGVDIMSEATGFSTEDKTGMQSIVDESEMRRSYVIVMDRIFLCLHVATMLSILVFFAQKFTS